VPVDGPGLERFVDVVWVGLYTVFYLLTPR